MSEEVQEYQVTDPQTALVASGASIVRLENSTQMQVAIQRPRNEATILSAALKELDLYPSMAEEALYMKPVGKNAETNRMTYAEGLSIRAAESLANRWTNSSYGCEISGEDEDTVSLAAVFLDYEQNTRHIVMARVSKSYKTKKGQIVRRDPDRLELAVKAEQSKALREVILRSLPAGLKREYENKVRTLLKGGKVENRKSAIVQRFKNVGIALETLEAHAGKKLADWQHDDLVQLLGIANAIRDGELTKEAAFSNGQGEEQEAPATLTLTVQPKEAEKKDEKKEQGNKPADIASCKRIPDDCEFFTWHGEDQWCERFQKACPRKLRG